MRAILGLLALLAASAAQAEEAGVGGGAEIEPGIGAGPHPLDGTIWDVEPGERIDPKTLAARLSAADIAILGEIHDNAAHHLAQAWLVGRLRPAGIAVEMIPQAQEQAIADLLAGGGAPGEIGPAIGWDETGWPDWAIYRPIFDAWRAQVYTGGGVPREALMQAGVSGAAGLAPDPRFAPALAQAPDPATQAALEDEMVAAHCDRLPREAAPGMVEVQRLRDASLAAATLRAHAALGERGGAEVEGVDATGGTEESAGAPGTPLSGTDATMAADTDERTVTGTTGGTADAPPTIAPTELAVESAAGTPDPRSTEAATRAVSATAGGPNDASRDGAGRPTVLITGNGHARSDRGVPAYLAAVEPGLAVVSLGILETDPEAQALADYATPYDYLWFTAPAEREDPCLSFR